jgi:hypothetical protein
MATSPVQFASSSRPPATSAVQSYSGRPDIPLPWMRLESEVVTWADRALLQARERAGSSPVNSLIPRIIQYLSGSQWPARPTAYGNSRPVTNRMFRQYWELVSLLTDGKPEPQIKCWDTEDGYSETQRLIGELLEPWAANPLYHDAFQDIVGFGLLAHGVGKVQWNRHLSGGLGDVQLLSINPLRFYKLGAEGPSTPIDECECLIECRTVTIESLVRRYGPVARLIKADADAASSLRPMRPSGVSSEQWGKYSPQMQSVISQVAGSKGMSSQNDSMYPTVEERIYWLRDPAINESSTTRRVGAVVRSKSGEIGYANWSYLVEPGMPLFPRGRAFSVAGGRVMEDTCNPYFHNLGPGPYVEFLPLRTAWQSPSSMSLMGNLIGPQDILNRLMAGMLETIKAGLLPTIVTPTDAISRSDLDNLSTTISGGKVEYNPLRSGGQQPKFREQPSFPTAAQWYTQTLMREMDQTTGSAAVDAAAQKEQIPSHDTMEMIQNSRSGMVRLMGRRLENFMNRSGQMVVSNMLQFYSLGHRTAILGDKGVSQWDFSPLYGSLMQRGMAPEKFVRKFQFSIRPGSALSFDNETRLQAAIVLNRQGIVSTQNVLRMLNKAGANLDIAQNLRELQQEALQKMAIGALMGGGKKGKK